MPLLDPTQPADSGSPTLGAADIRTLTGEVQQMFGGAGTSPVSFAVAPFITDTTTGLSTVPGPPTTALGIVTKGYVDGGAGFTGTAAGTNTYTTTLTTINGVAPASQAALLRQTIIAAFTNGNTGASTLNANGFGAQPITKFGSNALVGGEIPANSYVLLIWDGVEYQLQNVRPVGITALARSVGNPAVDVINTAVETTLFTYSLPGNTLGADGQLQLNLLGDLGYTAGTQTWRMRIYFGGTKILDTNIVNAGSIGGGAKVVMNGSFLLSNASATNLQSASGTLITTPAGTANGEMLTASNVFLGEYVGLGIDTTTAQTLQATIQLSADVATEFRMYSAFLSLILP